MLEKLKQNWPLIAILVLMMGSIVTVGLYQANRIVKFGTECHALGGIPVILITDEKQCVKVTEVLPLEF